MKTRSYASQANSYIFRLQQCIWKSFSLKLNRKYFKTGFSLRSKRFQSSYCAKVRAEATKKKVEEGGGGEKRKRLPANPTILKNAS